ncbi:hypothetical protein ABPG72_021436 [Tetrahymena utriculariae]
MASKLVFGYWNGRGRGQQIRFLLEYIEANYEEKTYFFSEPEQDEWFKKDKKVLKPFPNLPYIMDGDFYLSEHDVVIKYIVKKHPKYHELIGIGKGLNDEFIIDQLVSVINDIRATIKDLCFNPKVQEVKKEVLATTHTKFNQLIEFKDTNIFLLSYLTTADFKLIEVLLYYKALDTDQFNAYLSAFNPYIQQFHSLPRISEYLKTDRYKSNNVFFPIQKSSFTGYEFIQEFNKQFV